MKKELDTIDLTPTWESIIPTLVEVAVNGTTIDGRIAAMQELKRLARIVDQQIAKQKGTK